MALFHVGLVVGRAVVVHYMYEERPDELAGEAEG